ncbi:MAG: hypothetical protein IIY58_03180 [Aeriscardovia sp.]|nr:hypothetical protein [Aeriscardovia sp.]
MSLPITIMSLSKAYDGQEFYRELPHRVLDLRDIQGTSCYLDSEAQEEIVRRMEEVPQGGIHFLDSGNYHYLTYLWLRKVQEPFWLLVFDNHTDMQPPAFGDLLSCGGWTLKALETLPLLEGVVLVGPEEDAFRQTDLSLHRRVRFFGSESLALSFDALYEELMHLSKVPSLYISLDKDIFCLRDAVTDWDQGWLTLEDFLPLLSFLLTEREKQGLGLLGFDICGDGKEALGEDALVNDRTNAALLRTLGYGGACDEK